MNPSSLKFRRTGKLILLFTIICASQLYGMEPEQGLHRIEPKKKNFYKYLPSDLQKEIINKAIASSTDLEEISNAIAKLKILHNVSVDKNMLINISKMFPDKTKGEIIFAIEEPEFYQKIAAILKKIKDVNQTIDMLKQEDVKQAIDILKQENLAQDDLNHFTALAHMLADKFNRPVWITTKYFSGNPIAQNMRILVIS